MDYFCKQKHHINHLLVFFKITFFSMVSSLTGIVIHPFLMAVSCSFPCTNLILTIKRLLYNLLVYLIYLANVSGLSSKIYLFRNTTHVYHKYSILSKSTEAFPVSDNISCHYSKSLSQLID